MNSATRVEEPEVSKTKSSLAYVSIAIAVILACSSFCEAGQLLAAGDAERQPAARAQTREESPPAAPRRVPAEEPLHPIIDPTHADVVYGRASDRDLKLDVYMAESPTATPVVVFIHGGGWRRGSKTRWPEFIVRDLLPAGISVVSVEYRLSDVAIHPAQVNDCTRAVQFVRHKAGEWRFDPKRLGVVGVSAGAHLALMVGLRDDAAKPDSEDPVERQSSRVSCVVNFAGPTDFNLIQKIEHKNPAYKLLLGFESETPPQEIPKKLLDDVSPVTYVSSDDPPVFTCYGTEDTTVPPEHALELDERLREAGVESRLLKMEGARHDLGMKNRPEPREESVKFIKEHLLGGGKAGRDLKK